MAQHCSQQGMQFLMAVRGCQTDDDTYTPAVNIGWQQFCMSQNANATMGPTGVMGMNGTIGMGLPGTEAPVNGRARPDNSGSSSSSRVAMVVAGAALAVAAAMGL